MNICPICHKPTSWQGTITLTTTTGTYTTAGQFGIGDMCLGHTAWPVTNIASSTGAIVPPIAIGPPRQPVPDVFQAAFEKDLNP